MKKSDVTFPIVCKPTLYIRFTIILYDVVFCFLVVACVLQNSLSSVVLAIIFLAYSNLEFFLLYSPQLHIYREHIHIRTFSKTFVLEWKDIKYVHESSFRQRTLISFEKSFFPGNITGILHNRFQPTIILQQYANTNYKAAVEVLKARTSPFSA